MSTDLENIRVVNPEGGILAMNQLTGCEIYIDPGTLLHSIVASGAVGTVADYVPPPDPADPPRYASADEAIAALEDGIEDLAFAPLVMGIPYSERAAWNGKVAAARAYVSGEISAEDAEALSLESSITGQDVAELADEILARAQAFQKVAAIASGVRRKYRDRINAVSDPYGFEVEVDAAGDALRAALAEIEEGVE
ncbi:hypothetical protein PSM7751_03725 [Pseudooceanicola marinus]|uniref:Uncharacterized protein n=1 Tax=Pseudooceanicola marinus TaxID=396013 RepID=A0A1X7A4E2_9RHOB|nr:hypothetical protein [Pseudooceanicola marinus]PJE27159.1 hypothetical protein CVM50_17240 [Pseudooceanicola marinus]SLN70400.1 hypothetical protein PSM7751_03725 [Pseudooceanicola marinus]